MAVAHTTVNLDTDEFATLARLPGADLSKPRRKLTVVGCAMSIDEFHGHLTGLVLAETERPVEFAEQLMVALAAVGEVTQDDQFSGGGGRPLARSSCVSYSPSIRWTRLHDGIPLVSLDRRSVSASLDAGTDILGQRQRCLRPCRTSHGTLVPLLQHWGWKLGTQMVLCEIGVESQSVLDISARIRKGELVVDGAPRRCRL